MIKELKDLEYSEHLYRLKLDSLHFRRRRSDIIQLFKIVKGIDNIDFDMFFKFNKDSRTRGHLLKLVKNNTNLNVRLHTFSNRVINDWNNLSENAVQCRTVNAFKSTLKREWSNNG